MLKKVGDFDDRPFVGDDVADLADQRGGVFVSSRRCIGGMLVTEKFDSESIAYAMAVSTAMSALLGYAVPVTEGMLVGDAYSVHESSFTVEDLVATPPTPMKPKYKTREWSETLENLSIALGCSTRLCELGAYSLSGDHEHSSSLKALQARLAEVDPDALERIRRTKLGDVRELAIFLFAMQQFAGFDAHSNLLIDCSCPKLAFAKIESLKKDAMYNPLPLFYVRGLDCVAVVVREDDGPLVTYVVGPAQSEWSAEDAEVVNYLQVQMYGGEACDRDVAFVCEREARWETRRGAPTGSGRRIFKER